MDKKEILIERTIFSKFNDVFIIDTLTNQILLIKKLRANGTGIKSFINPLKLDPKLKLEDLTKFITLDIEASTSIEDIKVIGDFSKFHPIMISAFNFNSGEHLF